MMNKLFKTLTTAGFVLSLSILGYGSSAIASTPDGETPANEGVCNVLQADGITPGLYGLCVAYCEAQDLDLLADKDPPNSKILGNYNKRKQVTDPDMPCIQTPCPCWSTEQINGIVANSGVKTCTIIGNFAQIENQIETINGVAQRARIDGDRKQCRYLDRTTTPSPTSINLGNLTDEEVASCASQVINACAGL